MVRELTIPINTFFSGLKLAGIKMEGTWLSNHSKL